MQCYNITFPEQLNVRFPSLAWLLAPLLSLAPVAHAETGRPEVVATFSIIADIARVVGGDDAVVTSLVGPDGDSHAYEPSPGDVRKVARADLLLANGLEFEPWLDRVVAGAAFRKPVVKLSDAVERIPFTPDPHDHGHGDGHDHAHHHDHGEWDPHAWQDPRNGAAYAMATAEALAQIHPEAAPRYRARAEAYAARLLAIHATYREAFETLPDERRGFVTAHHGFGYFGRAFGLDVVAIAGLATTAEPSAGDVAHMIKHVREGRAAAIFVENISDARLAEQVAREGGLAIGGKLFSDALSGPEGDAPDYETLLKVNADRIFTALKGEQL